jgi:MFS transporter, DHA2 family, multidrug resistance protein
LASIAKNPRRSSAPAAPPPGVARLPMSNANRLAVTVVAMASTIMQVLDSTIANVALPHMRAALGATTDTITWVLTSYIVAAAIAMPLTGWLVDQFGRKALFFASITGFTLSSMLCGVSNSILMMVVARALQGVFGAFLVPLAQSTMMDVNPPERQSQVMSLWAMGVMIAPIMGPVLGGWLTEELNWRWVFFINVPIGFLSAVGLLTFLPATAPRPRRFDKFGFITLALGLAGLQLMLDRGAQNDWFESAETVIEAAIMLGALWMFTIHTFSAKQPLIPRVLLTDRNFMSSLVFVGLVIGLMIASSALLAPMLQALLGYDVITSGMMTAPRGIGMLISMVACGRLVQRIDVRVLLAVGLTISAYGSYLMTGISLGMDQRPVIISGFVQGLGNGLISLPLNLLAFATLAPQLRTEASSVYNLVRGIGASVAISTTTSILARNIQVAHADIGAHVTITELPMLGVPLIQQLQSAGINGLSMVDAEVNRQAAMLAYVDDYYLMFWLTIIVMPLMLLLRSPKKRNAEPAAAAASE